MSSLVIWFSGGLVSIRSEVGLGDLGGLSQPRLFCDSVKCHIDATLLSEHEETI